MEAVALDYYEEPHQEELIEYLSSEDGYWINCDVWMGKAAAFSSGNIKVADREKNWTIADFSTFETETLKNEMKYFILKGLKEKSFTACGVSANYLRAIRLLGEKLTFEKRTESFLNMDCGTEENPVLPLSQIESRAYRIMKMGAMRCIRDFYDERPEMEKDRWHLLLIPGVKMSATAKRGKSTLSFEEIPDY